MLNPLCALDDLIFTTILYTGDCRPHFIKKKPRIRPVQCIVTSHNSKADVNLDCVTLKAIFPTMLLVILDFYGLSGSFENLIKVTDSHLLKISIYTTVSPQLHIWTR